MNSFVGYNVLGDIHARSCWKSLVRKDCINIFVGDYFDPYEYVSLAEQLYNFQKILDFKRNHPETILLYGNHDLHYLISGEHYSRFDAMSAFLYRQTFIESQSLFNDIAYPIGDVALVTHAGVTKEWYEKCIGSYQSEPVSEVARNINELWLKDMQAFTFSTNATSWMDHCGTSPTHSPLWIRPWVLENHNLFAGTPIKQIFGHTQTKEGIITNSNLICVDCLGSVKKFEPGVASLIINN